MKRTIKSLSILTAALAGLVFSSGAYATDESFSASIQILAALTITEQTALAFPATEASSSAQTTVVAPSDSGAATFDIAGEASSGITASVVESSISMTVGSSTITVDSFIFGGSLDSSGTATLNGSGALTGAAVGATANIPASPTAGSYSGTLTFRVVYN